MMVFSACCIWILFTCYLHIYMSSAYYLSICVLCTHYLQRSLISSCLTDNANVIHTSSLVLFIYPIMENISSAPFQLMPSAPLLDDTSSAPLPDDVSSAPFRMTCHPHPFWMTCHLHSKETCLTSLKSEKQVTGQPDN